MNKNKCMAYFTSTTCTSCGNEQERRYWRRGSYRYITKHGTDYNIRVPFIELILQRGWGWVLTNGYFVYELLASHRKYCIRHFEYISLYWLLYISLCIVTGLFPCIWGASVVKRYCVGPQITTTRVRISA